MRTGFLKQKNNEIGVKLLFAAAAGISILAAVTIFVFLFARGIPAMSKIGLFQFLFGDVWMPSANDIYSSELVGQYGILTMIVGSLFATVGAIVIGGTLGYFTAVFLSRFCPKKLKGILTQLINLLAGIPSVIYGFFGMKVLLPVLGEASPNGSGSGLLAVSIILGIMIMPTIASLSRTSIDAVPDNYYEGARALGDSHSQAVFGTVVPAAKSGIAASFILGVGRAVGETMAVIMVAGNNTVFPSSLFSSFRTMTANVVLEMGYAGEVQLGALIATGCVLFFFVLVINLMFQLISGKDTRKSRYKGRLRAFAARRRNYNVIADKAPVSLASDVAALNLSVESAMCAEEVVSVDATYKKRHRFSIFTSNLKCALNCRPKIITEIKHALSYLCAFVSVASLICIIIFVLSKGLPNISLDLITRNFKYGEAPTIMPSIVATLMLVSLSMVIAIPMGVCTAVFLSEYTKPGGKTVKLIRGAIEILSGIPSIVYGLFGMVFFCTFMKLGTSILAGSLTVTLMIIPVICRATEESLKSVPSSYREGSFALGAGKARTIFKVVLPSALPGILAAVILAVGRVISESAPLMFTMGASLKGLPQKGFMSSGTSLAVALYVLAGEGLHINEAYATACVLILIVLTLNILSTLLVAKLKKRFTGAK